MPSFNRNFLSTNKEDDDPILELKEIYTDDFPDRIVTLASVPFYRATGHELLSFVLHTLEKVRGDKASGKERRPMFVLPVDPYRITWLQRKKSKYLGFFQKSFINLPDGGGMIWMSRMFRNELPSRVKVANFTMNLIRLAQAKNYTVFIVGSRDRVLDKLSSNLLRSFPRLRIVGKHHGYLKGEAKERVNEAVRKTDPHIIIVGLGLHNGLRWMVENENNLGNAIVLNVSDALDILAGESKKAPDSVAERGYTWLWRSLNRPWRWHRMVLVIRWWLHSIWVRLRTKPKNLDSSPK